MRADQATPIECIALHRSMCLASQDSNAFAFYRFRKSDLRQKLDGDKGVKHHHEGRAVFWCATRRLLCLHSSWQQRRPLRHACVRCSLTIPSCLMCCLLSVLVDSHVLADIVAVRCIQRRGAAGGCHTAWSVHWNRLKLLQPRNAARAALGPRPPGAPRTVACS